tara:strand:+ start:1604 stop:2350 length:747 start_codon:yes stop_codon:yes gene_type:complete
MTRMLIAGNWKMNGDISMAQDLATTIARGGGTSNCEYLLCPPFTVIQTVADAIGDSGISLGGQDCHAAESGAHTGDISIGMLTELGCRYVIVGHSERRSNHDESDADVKAKAEAAVGSGLTAIVCVGESEAERGSGNALAVVGGQVASSLPDAASATNTVIAYEPVWAIGTGKVPTLAQIAEMHLHIQSVLAQVLDSDSAKNFRILYGGSVNAENADEILRTDGVGGALVGGASLKAESFLAIGRSCP